MSTGLLLIIIAASLFVVALLYFVFKNTEDDDDTEIATQFNSGVYAVYRSSPRENINTIKPDKASLEEFLKVQTEDMNNNTLSEKDKVLAIDNYFESLEENICTVEKADENSISDFMIISGNDCKVCKNLKNINSSVTRKEIHGHPELIPPYFPGCDCKLSPIAETDSINSTPLKKDSSENYDLPNWKNIKKIG